MLSPMLSHLFMSWRCCAEQLPLTSLCTFKSEYCAPDTCERKDGFSLKKVYSSFPPKNRAGPAPTTERGQIGREGGREGQREGGGREIAMRVHLAPQRHIIHGRGIHD